MVVNIWVVGSEIASIASLSKAAIIVIQEIFGVNPGIRSKCDSWAEEGYLAVAPDLFFRMKPGIELDPDVEARYGRCLRCGHCRR